MDEAEIEAEKRAILEQLGEGTGELLRRVQEARRQKEKREGQTALEEQAAQEDPAKGLTRDDDARRTTERDREHEHAAHITSPTPHRFSTGLAAKPSVLRVKSLENMGQSGEFHSHCFVLCQLNLSVPSPLPAKSSTRPSSRTGRKLRFAEVTPDDIHVYESAPRSPKRVLALPPPPDTKDDSIVSLGTYNQNATPFKRHPPVSSSTKDQPVHAQKDDNEPEEGTPESIRRRYFPGVLANDPSLAWIQTSSQDSTDLSVPRFDLHGAPISASLSATLPSHLGLHHHAEGSHAGYTVDDIFLLSRSTVPAQRASMLGILSRIARRLNYQVRHPDSPEKIVAFVGQERELRKRILAAGLAAIDQIGSLGARAVEVVWECLVEWDTTTSELGGIELGLAPDIVSLLQLDYFLPQVTDVFSYAALPYESLVQLLAVVHWLAQQSNKVAEMITNTPRLIPAILTTFLLTPIPPKEDSPPPNPLTLQLLITLTSASRSNASALLDPADALLRFITLLPPSSPYAPSLASTVLAQTLRFYTTLASYGLYSHIATTASQVLTSLAFYIFSTSPTSGVVQLRTAWASLAEAWTICATDPHATSPPHEILWSQVRAWGWATDIRRLREGLGNETSDREVYGAIWNAEAAWLEGARVNGIKGGEAEREEALQILRRTFSAPDGTEHGIVHQALEEVKRELTGESPTTIQDGERVLASLASAGKILASALRLFLACLPPLDDGVSLSAPPFALPLSELSALSAMLVKHPIWSLPFALGTPYLQVHLRPLTFLIVQFHRVSRYIPGTTPQLWFAQALVFLSRLLPGDEFDALAMLDAFSLVTPRFVGVDPAEVPQTINVDVLRPFFEYAVRPRGAVYVAPLRPNPDSISRSATLRLPFSSHGPGGSDTDTDTDIDGDTAHRTFAAGLPLTRDVLFTPLAHLLRSGTSPVFRAPPAHWTASETDIVRATLLLALAARRVLLVHGLEGFVHGASETVFACMRVCMLEHGVGGGTEGEVFRDAGVERLMGWLIEPFTVRAQERVTSTSTTSRVRRTLEDASAAYLGSTPFYQFYTDLVTLYGAVSFGHKLFAALVATPLAMGYAVDYRRALWCGEGGAVSGPGDGSAGLGDAVRNMRIPIEDVICTDTGADEPADPREYLYPIEQDAGMLGTYVTALVTRDGAVQAFLRLVAVHHVACVVWGDLDSVVGMGADTDGKDGVAKGTHTERWEEMRAKLLRVVLVRGEVDVVKDVVLYQQRSRGAMICPPSCYQGGDVSGCWREERLEFVRRSMGEGAMERVKGLLLPTT